MSIRKLGIGAFAIVLAGSFASAAVEFDQDATPDAIFGSGNANGSYTTDRDNGIELALRGKLRFNAANMPENTFNSNGDGTYSFAPGTPPGGGFGFCFGCPTTPVWNFEWSVNSDYLNDPMAGPAVPLDTYTYEIGLDFDPGRCTTDFQAFDHITPNTPPANVPAWDHSTGNNLTPNGGGTEQPADPAYSMAIAVDNVAQNSWSYEFFNNPPFDTFDPTVDGTYDVYLKAFDMGGNELASVTIQIIVGTGGPACVGACCTDGAGTNSECVEATQVDCEAGGGLYLGDTVACADVDDCEPLAVELDAISATQTKAGVAIRWTTAVELDTVGFRVIRETGSREKNGRTYVGDLVPAIGFGTQGASYEVIDTEWTGRGDARYYLVDIDIFNRETLHGPFAIQPGTRTKPGRSR